MNFVMEAYDIVSMTNSKTADTHVSVAQRIECLNEMVALMSELNCHYENNTVLAECGRCGETVFRDDPTGFCPLCSVCTHPGCASPILYDKGGRPRWTYRSCGRCMKPMCPQHTSIDVNEYGDQLCVCCQFT
jgi:hypothetical protein